MAARVSRRREVAAVVDLLEAGTPTKQVAQILAAYLVEQKATKNLELYLRDLKAEIAARFSLVAADVTSARKLNDDLEQQIVQAVKRATGAKEVELAKSVDPSLIGGVIVSTSDAYLDGSIRNRIKKLKSI